ncbi:siroheme synthase CysG [Buchnera aphidicola]|uniref:siroheme synthase CysG n=1 Tax=Buchnera aphidicola TaxID=9 RepID=UPI0034648ADA
MNYLPIFIDLKYKNVLVVGAGSVAFNKIVLLLRAGAKVQIIAQEVNTEIEMLLQKKKIFWIAKEFDPVYLKKVFLVIAATNNMDLNKRIFQICNDLFLFVNIVDNQSKCSFIFPSIIDRSPIMIAISSGGTAPVLLRFLREKIESIIPIKLGTVAKIAGKLRILVKNRFVSTLERRHFWEKLFKSVFIEQIISGKIKNAINTFRKYISGSTLSTGKIILVGAGPGDSSLLTLRGLQVLQEADIVLYDYLITTDVLDLIRRDAKRICVGKSAGIKTISQSQINDLLISLAHKGNTVVRLKGGDPFIFGRGGEELEAAKQAGINIQVVPGITAGIGISAYTGIPLTHRKYAKGVIFITGHNIAYFTKKNLSMLCDSFYTLVIYMGSLQAVDISRKLILHGCLQSTPVAIVGQGTTINQKVIIGRLDEMKKMIKLTLHPSLLIVGNVVNLHKKLEWFYDSNVFKTINYRSSIINLL